MMGAAARSPHHFPCPQISRKGRFFLQRPQSLALGNLGKTRLKPLENLLINKGETPFIAV